MTTDVGSRLQIIRTLNGWSQRELAKRAGVTNSTISMIEQGRVSPSVSSLQKVLGGIPMSLADFFTLNLETQSKFFYRASEFVYRERDGIQYKFLGANQPDRALSIQRTVYPPGSDTGPQLLAGDNEEGGIVEQGQLEAIVAGLSQTLEVGEGYYFPGRVPHRFRNIGKQDCVVIIGTTIGTTANIKDS